MSAEAFLRLDIEASSPARLRLLLIQKAVGLSHLVLHLWEEGDYQKADQWILRIRDILSELLEGVTDKQNSAAGPISDLYVYLIQLLDQSAAGRVEEGLKSLSEVLEIDMETWSLFVRQENISAAPNSPAFSAHGSSDFDSISSSIELDLQM